MSLLARSFAGLLGGLLCWLAAAPAAHAQAGGAKFEGVVQDAQTRQPVPFAALSLLGAPVGVVSTAEGRFALAVPAGRLADSVVVSCLGYAPTRLALSAARLGAPQTVLLRPQPVQLQEVAVRGYTAETLLKQAVRTTHARLLSPVLLQTYYREFVRINDVFFKFADGLVDFRLVRNPRRPARPDVQVRVRESRARELQKAAYPVESLPSIIDVEQAITGYERDSDVRSNFLDSADFSFFKYELRASAGAAEEPFYLISFTPTTHDAQHLQQGTVRIDRQTLCIQAIDCGIPAELRQYGQAVSLLGIRVQLNAVRKHLEYRQLAGRCYLSFLRLDFGVGVQSSRWPRLQYDFSSEMLVRDLTADAPAIPRAEQYRSRSLFKNGTHYQRRYWEEGNVVPATPEEQAAIAELKDEE